jgi:hypothetical protein
MNHISAAKDCLDTAEQNGMTPDQVITAAQAHALVSIAESLAKLTATDPDPEPSGEPCPDGLFAGLAWAWRTRKRDDTPSGGDHPAVRSALEDANASTPEGYRWIFEGNEYRMVRLVDRKTAAVLAEQGCGWTWVPYTTARLDLAEYGSVEMAIAAANRAINSHLEA